MNRAVTRLCFDQSELLQISSSMEYELIDLTDIKNTYCYCERKTLSVIGQRLQKRKNRGITLLGSGNYHYVTYLLLSELTVPFSLVLFDHHTDMFPSPSPEVISCGSWVSEAIRQLPLLRKVVLIGTRDDLTAIIPRKAQRQISVFPEQLKGWSDKGAVLSVIPTDNVYLSIDKDVLAEPDAVTDWDQGTMKLSQLLDLLQSIAVQKRVCGLDLCGEYPLSLVNTPRQRTVLQTNARANGKVIETMMQALSLRNFGAAS